MKLRKDAISIKPREIFLTDYKQKEAPETQDAALSSLKLQDTNLLDYSKETNAGPEMLSVNMVKPKIPNVTCLVLWTIPETVVPPSEIMFIEFQPRGKPDKTR